MSKDGTWRPYFFTGLRIVLDDKVNLIGVGIDITERKQVEGVLKALNLRQEALLSAIPDIIMEVDENKIYTWANRPGYEFFGEDVIGKETAFYFEGEQETYDLVDPLFKGSEDVIYAESWQRRKDGQKRLLAWWCRVLKDEKGIVLGALSSARDITEHKQAEEALRESEERYWQLVENANEAIFVAQDEWMKFYNPKTAEILGYSKGNQPALSFLDYVHPEDQEMVFGRYLKRQEGEYFPQIYSFRIADGQGKTRWVEINTALIVWDGRPATLVFLNDVSKRKQAEEKVTAGVKKLQKAIEGIVQAMSATV